MKIFILLISFSYGFHIYANPCEEDSMEEKVMECRFSWGKFNHVYATNYFPHSEKPFRSCTATEIYSMKLSGPLNAEGLCMKKQLDLLKETFEDVTVKESLQNIHVEKFLVSIGHDQSKFDLKIGSTFEVSPAITASGQCLTVSKQTLKSKLSDLKVASLNSQGSSQSVKSDCGKSYSSPTSAQ